jgi:hypothetical protein
MNLLATEGWVANMIESGGFTTVGSTFVCIVLAAILLACFCALNDLRRFGRIAAPWWIALAYAALFSAFGYWIFGLPGTLPGLFCVWAFQRGRRKSARVSN